MAATAKNKNKNSNVEVFPPSDRELALRGKIKTGWSTVALHQNLKNLGLSRLEITKIEKVLERAEAVERVNQLRIGVELMKHEQNKKKHLGDGQRTCLICNIDFSSHQRGRRPVSVQFCDHCGSAVCSSCMLADKQLTGTSMSLCPLCYEEREIWKRSGAWFNNALPVIDISQSELEKFEEQQKVLQSRTFTLGKHTDETTAREFVNPYQLEAESSSDEDEELNSLQLCNKTPSPDPPAAAAASTIFPPPISFVDKPHLQQALQRPSAYKPAASSTFPRSISPSDAMQDFRGRSDSDEPIGRKLEPLGDREDGKSKGFLRRGAMSTKDKDRYESSRRKVIGSVESARGNSIDSTSPPSAGSPAHRGARNNPPTAFHPTSQPSSSAGAASGDIAEQLRRQLANPPPTRPPPQLVSGEPPFDQSSTVEVHVEPPTPKIQKTAAVVRRRKKEKEERVRPLEDEFKKVAVAPTSSQQPLPPPSKKPPVLSSSPGDEFKKVNITTESSATTGGAAASTSTSKPPPPNKPAPIPESDEFHKVTHKIGGVAGEGAAATSAKPPPPSKPAPVPESEEFAKVTAKAKPPPRVAPSEDGESRKVDTTRSSTDSPSRKLPVIPPSVGEFRKVHPKPAEAKKPSPPPPVADEFRKVHPKPAESKKVSPPPPPLDEFRKVHPKPVEVKKASPPPPALDEFRKVHPKPVETKKVSPPPPSLDEFRKVHPKPAEVTKASPPPPALDEFRKVHPKPEKTSPLPPSQVEGVTTAKPVDVKKPIPRPRADIDEFRKVSAKQQTPPPSLPSSEPATVFEPPVQESPRRVPEVTPRSKLPRSDDDNKSIVSTSSLASQSSRSTAPSESPSHDHSPDQLDIRSRRGLPTRQGEIDADDQPMQRFRTRSGAMKPNVQRRQRSGSPTSAHADTIQQHHTPPPSQPAESREAFIEDDSEDFQPRVRTRSGAVDSRMTPRGKSPGTSSTDSISSRGGSIEPKDSLKQQRRAVLDRRSSQEESTGSSDDISQPRSRTRSRAFHGRQPSNRGRQQEKEDLTASAPPLASTAELEEDAPSHHPRMRTRSRAFHGDSQRPKKFTRTPSPRAFEASQSMPDPQASLELPHSRPRSSSIGQRSLQRDISSGRTSPGPKPDGAFGSVELEMEYAESENLLKVTIARCKGLRAMDGNGFSDPYVKLFLLPGNRIHKFQTRTVYKNLDPVFDETFSFYSVSMEAMKTKQLCLIVMDYDEFSADDFIGGTRVKLYEVLYAQSHKINIRRLLDDNIVAHTAMEDKTRGRVQLTFSYSMEKQMFSVYVDKADRLVPDSTKGHCDPYVKCYFESSSTGSCIKKKTTVCKKTLSPVFNQALDFPVKLSHLGLARMTVSVWDRSKLPSSEIGNIQFRDAVFWKGFLAQPSLTVTEWYTLYATDHPRGTSPKQKILTLPRKLA